MKTDSIESVNLDNDGSHLDQISSHNEDVP